MSLAIIAITDGGADLARRLCTRFPGAHSYLPERFRQKDAIRYSAEPVLQLLPRLFFEYDALVCIMATGIVVRVLAPHLRGKDKDPAVVVCDEKGRHAISLLSGHLGGANRLAQQIAAAIGAEAVITTATDLNGLPAWDDVARREALAIAPLKNIVRLNSLLLEQQKIVLVDPQRLVASYYTDLPNIRLLESPDEAPAGAAKGFVFVTNRLVPEWDERKDLLRLHPQNLVVGIGCNRQTSSTEIEQVVAQIFARMQLYPGSIASLATIDAKGDEAGLLDYAQRVQLPINFYTPDELNRVEVPSPPSGHALAAVGATGVCEPAALLAAGPGGEIIVCKQKCGNVTVAVAQRRQV